MEQNFGGEFPDAIREFRLPAYDEIPDTGLYLEQAARYVSEALQPLPGAGVTGSMVSNYVKRGLVANPVRKQYGREQIAHLFFIAVAKSILSLDALSCFLRLQQRTYPLEEAYNYFCRALENLLLFQFELKETIDLSDEDSSDEKRLLYSCIAAVVQKVHLEKCLDAIVREE